MLQSVNRHILSVKYIILSRKLITSGRRGAARHGPNGLNGKQLRVTHYVPRRTLPCRPLVMGFLLNDFVC